MEQPSSHKFRECYWRESLFPGLTAPYHDQMPPKSLKLLLMLFISLDVALEFRLPKLCIRRWRSSDLASRMAMPKAASDFNDCFVLRQDDIGMSWQTLDVKSESKAVSVKERANKHLRLCIFGPDAAPTTTIVTTHSDGTVTTVTRQASSYELGPVVLTPVAPTHLVGSSPLVNPYVHRPW